MFRRMLFVGAGGLTLLWALGNPDLATAQKGPGKPLPGGLRPGGLPPAQIAARPTAPKPPATFRPPRPDPGIKVLPGTNRWPGRDSDRWGRGWPGRDWHHDWDRWHRWPSRRTEINNTTNTNITGGSSSATSGGGGSPGGYPVFVGGAAGTGAGAGSFDGSVRSSSDMIRSKEPLYRETFVEDRERTARLKLELALGTSAMSEIVTGVPLNVLLDDLRRFSSKIALSSTPLSEDILMHINVTTTEHHGNLGLLRNGGKLSWPYALELDKVLSKAERNDMELKLQAAVQQAVQGNISRTCLAEVKELIGAAGDKLVRNGKVIPGGYYLDAKRFLDHLDAARIALENDEAPAYFKFQKWIRGGKTIQDVAGYMIREGLQFAPALPGDEGAYRAVHSGFAAYDVAVHQEASPLVSARQ